MKSILFKIAKLASKRGIYWVLLYRCVSREEAEDIAETGRLLETANSLEGKWLAYEESHAQQWGAAMTYEHGFRIVEILVPRGDYAEFHKTPALDGIGPGCFGTIDELKRAMLRIIPL
jgi:hypothetical protein